LQVLVAEQMIVFSQSHPLILPEVAEWIWVLEGIAKLASRVKFDDFFVGSVFRKATYPLAIGALREIRIQQKKRGFDSEWSFAIPSLY
jgi:hypothetical protein